MSGDSLISWGFTEKKGVSEMAYFKIVLAVSCAFVFSACVSHTAVRKGGSEQKIAEAPPKPDQDGDGITDDVDKCPKDPETVNGYRDADGCPDVDPSKLSIHGGVSFDVNSTDIQDVSDGVISQAAGLLKQYPAWKVQIEGRTDTYGAPEYNIDLSTRRAEAVKKRLVKKFGIDAGRITTVGYGGTRPVASLETREGRIANRRIDFIFSEE